VNCPICTDICCEPIVTACQHTFCRICLYQSTVIAPDGRHCPVCRQPVTVLDEQGALLPIDLRAETAAKALIPPDEYEQRVEAAAECFDKMSAMSSEELPVFYLGSGCRVGQDISLHLFEPRYKILIRRALEGSRRFVFATRQPSAQMEATVVEVVQAQMLPDGRALVAGRGVLSVVMDRVWVADGTAGLWMCSCQTSEAGRSQQPLPATANPPRSDTAQISHLPVFYGGGTFPRSGQQTSLRLFEPRYKVMVRRVVAGSQQFIWSQRQPDHGDEAAVVKIESASFLPDGQAQITVRTVRVIRIQEAWQEEALHGLYCCSFRNDSDQDSGSNTSTSCRCVVM